MTETIQQLKEDIAILQEKLQKLEEIEKQPRMNLQQEGEYAVVSYHDKTYYRLEGETTFSWYIKKDVSEYHIHYRSPNLVMVVDAETERLLEGLYYNHIQVKKEKEQQIKELVRESVKWCEEHPEESVEDYLKPHTPEKTEKSLRESFVKAQQTEKWKETQRKIDEEDSDKNFKNSLDLIREWGEKNKPPTLKELLWEWWEDIFTRNSDLDADASIDYLVDILDRKFIPPSSDRNGYEWEKCLKMMREKLR